MRLAARPHWHLAEKSGTLENPPVLLGQLANAYHPQLIGQAMQAIGHDGVMARGRMAGTGVQDVAVIYPNHLHKLRSPAAAFLDLRRNHFLAANGSTAPAAATFDPRVSDAP